MATLEQLRSVFGGANDNEVLKRASEELGLSREQIAKDIGYKNDRTRLGDVGRSLKAGVEQIPGMVTGLADLAPALIGGVRPFTNMADKLGAMTGFTPGQWAKDTQYSDAYNASQQDVGNAWDTVDAVQKDQSASKMDYIKTLIANSPELIAAYAKNPLYTINQVAQSLPSMVAGGVGSKALMGIGRVAGVAENAATGIAARAAMPGVLERTMGGKIIGDKGSQLASEIAGGIGEGVVQAGQAMDQSEGTDQRRNAIGALASGAIDAGIAFGAGHAAHALGLETAGTAMAKAGDQKLASEGTSRIADGFNFAKRVGAGGLNEGLLQEFPQSIQEQIWQNYAEGKPLMEGVARQGIEGGLSGAVMGAGANFSAGNAVRAEKVPETGPLTRGANAGIETRAQTIDATGQDPANPSPPPVAPTAPIVDPVLTAIANLPDGPRQTAEQAYAVLNSDSGSGAKKMNQQLLDQILEQGATDAGMVDPLASMEKQANRDLQEQRDFTPEPKTTTKVESTPTKADLGDIYPMQAGDIGKADGSPIANKGVAMVKSKKLPGSQVVQVMGGWVVRPEVKSGTNSEVSAIPTGNAGPAVVDATRSVADTVGTDGVPTAAVDQHGSLPNQQTSSPVLPAATANAVTNSEPLTPTPVAESQAPAPKTGDSGVAPTQVRGEPKLPKDLTGGKPRYGYGGNNFTLNFSNDIDRAAYIAAQATPSKRDADYLKFAMDATGMTEAQVRAHGAVVRDSIKQQAKTAQPGALSVPDIYKQKETNAQTNEAQQSQAPGQQAPATGADSVIKFQTTWRKEFESAKNANDKDAIQSLYDKVRVSLNGPAQASGDKVVGEFQKLKKEIEDYAQVQGQETTQVIPQPPAKENPNGNQSTTVQITPENTGQSSNEKEGLLKPKYASKDDLDHLFGVDQKRKSALDRIAKGTAYFSTKSRATAYISGHGLKDTHEVVQHPSGANRYDIKAKSTTAVQEKQQYTPAEREKIGKAFLEKVKTDPSMVTDYIKTYGNVIDPDKAKKMMPEYSADPSQFTHASHEGSSLLAKKVYEHYLNTLPKGSNLLFTAGGGGSGKSATLPRFKNDSIHQFHLTYDATLSDLAPSKTRIDAALEAGHKVTILYTNRDSIEALKLAMKRERVVRINQLAKAHTNAPNTIRSIVKDYADNQNVSVVVMNNHGKPEDISIGHLDDLPSKSYNEHESGMLNEATKQLESGAISQAKFDILSEGLDSQTGGRSLGIDTHPVERKAQGNEPSGVQEVHEGTVGQSPVSEPVKVSANSIFTEDAAAAARARLKSKLGTLHSGIDPEMMMDGITLAGYHIEKGARTFTAYAKAMISDLGDGVKPYLKSWYSAISFDPRASEFKGMDDHATMAAIDLENLAKDDQKAHTVSEDQNATLKLDSTSPSALEGTPAQEIQGTGEVGSTVASTDASSRSDSATSQATDRPGTDSAGGVHGSQERVPVSSGRTGKQPRGSKKLRLLGDAGLQPDLGFIDTSGGTGGLIPVNAAPNSAPIAPPAFKPADFTITDDFALGEGGQKSKYQGNVAAIRLIKQLNQEDRPATPSEQEILARYVGWGGIAQAFDESNAQWSKEHAELKNLLSSDDYEAARTSTRYAHYTSREVVQDGIYAALKRFGFNGGRALEDGAGVGNFIGLMPTDMRSASRFTAIERDPVSAQIAKYLYPQQNIQQADFTQFVGNDDFYDVSVGNPPFASDPQVDQSGRKHLSGLSLHNYFFAKAVDMLREGGILAKVVTNSFLDAKTDNARQYISERTKFLGAIRLPNNAFSKNANTEVTTDLIFLQKRPESEWGSKQAKADAKAWLGVGEITDREGRTVALNQYFIDHPDMMLGKFGAYGTMYRGESPALIQRPGQDTAQMLKDAVARLPENVYVDRAISNTQSMQDTLVKVIAQPSVHEGGYFTDGDKLMQRIKDIAGEARAQEITPLTQWTEKTKLGDAGFARIKALSGMRETLRTLLAAELANDPKMDQLRKTLNTQYDEYAKEHGLINDAGTLRVFDDDPDFPLLASLEHDYKAPIGPVAAKSMGIKPVKSTAKKGPIFTRRVVDARQQVRKVQTPADALAVSMAERGKLDSEYIGKLLGRDANEVLSELASGEHPLLFKDPANDEYVLRDAYLSGNVRAKLAQAHQAGMFNNIRALEKVQPEDVGAHQITAKIGSPWVPESVYADFAKHLLGEGTEASIKYAKATGGYSAYIKAGNETAQTNTWGTKSYPASDLLSALLNNKPVKVTWTDKEGTHLDVEATENANIKAQDIRNKFQDWLFSDSDRSGVLVRAYNDTNNNYVTRSYDGQWMSFPGKVPDSIVKFRKHQRDAIARVVQDRTALLDHAVGAGKTWTIVSSAMELRRTGLAKKPMIAVPNHLVKQWASDFYQLYPGANILTATKKDFAKDNRRKFLAKIATGDWDAVIIAHSSFGFIKPDPQFEAQFNKQQIKKILDTIKDVENGDGEKQQKKRTVKQLEGLKERLENRIKALRDKPMDSLLDFGEIGVDQLYVDEAHMFKNLMYSTKMQNIAGLGDAAGSQRAYDMYVKANQIFNKNGRGQGLVFATGTPISNSLAEMYHMMRYLMPQQMEDMGFNSFDAWANTYASVEQVWMQKASGDGFKAQNRMSNFVNTTELLKVFDQVSDTVTMNDIQKAYSAENNGAEFPLPKLKGGKRAPVSLRKSDAQASYMAELAARALKLEKRKGPPKKGEDNVLVIMSDGRKAAMDIRLVDPIATTREPGGRIDRASQEIAQRYQQYNAVKGTQLVFSDLGTPLNSSKKELAEYHALQERIQAGAGEDLMHRAAMGDEAAQHKIDDSEAAQDELDAKGRDWLGAIQAAERGFSVYDDLRSALVEKGIPLNEIAFIHDYNTDDRKAGLFQKMNSGQIRVLMGSTPKLGAGTNVQERLVALHHLDVPWKPSDVEQREGRIIRQGNKLANDMPGFEVEVLAYVTQDTLDMRMWQTQETKLKMINQLRTRKIGRDVENAFEDLEMSAGEMQAAATGNIDLLREIQIKGEIKKLEQRKRAFDAQKSDLQMRKNSVASKLATLPNKITNSKVMAEATDQYRQGVQNRVSAFKATIDGKEYTDSKQAGSELLKMIDARVYALDGKPITEAEFNQIPEAKREEQKAESKAAPLHVNFNGTEYKSRAALQEAFSDSRGDVDPINWTFDGKDYIRRSVLEKTLGPKIQEAITDESVQKIGNLGPFQVSIEGQRHKGGQMFEVILSHKDQTVSSTSVTLTNDQVVSTDIARVVRMAENLAQSARQQHDYEMRQLEDAKKQSKELESTQIPDAWPEQAKLEELRKKHREVLQALSGAGIKHSLDGETLHGEMGAVNADGNDADVVFSRTPDKASGQATATVEKQVEGITSRWANAPKIVVANDMNDPRIPERVRLEDQKQRSGGATGTPEGFYYKGTAYLIASQLKTPQDTVRVLMHEALGHGGLRGVFGDQLRPILNQLAALRKADVKAKAEQYGLDMKDPEQRLQAAEEVLADMAQTHPELGYVKRAIAIIRSWIRRNIPGFKNMALSDSEIVNNWILPARGFVERGSEGNVAPAFSRGTNEPVTNPNDVVGNQGGRSADDSIPGAGSDARLATSKIRNQDGSLKKVYHGTTRHFNGFSLDEDARDVGGFWFTDSGNYAYDMSKGDGWDSRKIGSKGRVISAYLASKNPKVLDVVAEAKKIAEDIGVDNPTDSMEAQELLAGGDGWDRFVRDAVNDAKRKGHDSLVIENFNDGRMVDSTAYVIFDPSNIVVIPNESTAPESGGAMFSRSLPEALSAAANNVRDVKLPAGYKVNDFFKSEGKLNWWHKTIGTQYNLAQRSPEFGKVFNGVQNFLNDVSYFATEAANMAPSILPKLDGFKDILKNPVTASDNKAIAAPIFEGTLTWARDESGKAVKQADLVAAAKDMPAEKKAQRLLRNSHITEQVLKMWKGLPLDQYETLINNKYERDMLRAGVVFSDSELKSLFNLTPGQIALYKEFRAATDKSINDMAIADMIRTGGKDVQSIAQDAMDTGNYDAAAVMLQAHLKDLAEGSDRSDVLNELADSMIKKADRAKDLIDHGYAPLSRFGTHSLDVVSNGERVYFGLFESKAEANKMGRQMRANYPDAAINQGTMSQEEYKLFNGVSPETVELFGEMLGLDSQGDDAQHQAFQQYLKLAKNSRSSMKRMIERKGIAGFSEDPGRVLAGFVYSNSRHTSSGLHMGSISQSVQDISKGQGELKDAAMQLFDYVRNPQEEAAGLKGLMFAQYLGGSVASAMVNMLQPVNITFPWLSQYGGVVKAAGQLKNGLRDAVKKSTGDAKLDAALKKAEEDGVVSPQEVFQLMAQAQGRATLKPGDGTKMGDAAAKASNALSKVSLAWGKVFSVAEQFNRRATFIAAYRTAVEQGIPNPAAFGEKAVNETQFVYSKAARPRWARGAIGGTLFTFKSYAINYVELLHRMATSGPEGRKAALLSLAVLFMMSGGSGLPFSDDLDDLIDGIMQRLGYNFSNKQARQEFFTQYLGRQGAQIMERGISGLAGVPIDVSGRLGMGNLIPGTGLLTKKQDHTRDVLELAGPAGDIAKRSFDAAGKIVEGNIFGRTGALATLSPTAVRNAIQAKDMADTGMYRDQTGKKVIDVDAFDIASKAIGFQPNDVAKVQDATGQVQDMIGQNKMRSSEISNKWAQGLFEKDQDKVQEARDELKRWNDNNPMAPIRIQMPAIIKRVREMSMTKEQRIAKAAPASIRATVRKELADN